MAGATMKYYKTLAMLVVLCVLPLSLLAHEWKMWGTLKQQRAFGYVAPLSATSAIVVGGFPDFVFGSQHFGSQVTRSCEILDVKTGEVRYTDSTAVPHADGPIVRMSNGLVVVLGGIMDGNEGITTVVEAFDAQTETWTTLGNLLLPRRQQQAIALDDHRIMIACGRDASLFGTAAVEIFDVALGTCMTVAPYPHRLTNHKLMMIDSVVYLVGGRESGPGSKRYSDCYYYNESDNKWEFAFDLPASMPLLEGIQVYGGGFTSGGSVTLADNRFSDVVYQISANGATALPGRLTTSVKGHCFAAWVGDTVISFGGENDDAGSSVSSSWVNTVTAEVAAGPDLNIGRRYGMSVALFGDGNTPACVLAVAGVMTNGKVTPTIEILTSPACASSDLISILRSPVLTTLGNASMSEFQSVRLTNPVAPTAGAVWLNQKFSLRSGLSTTFSFSLRSNGSVGTTTGEHANAAIALVLQNSSPSQIGASGLGRGYENIPNAIAIEFDLYDASHSGTEKTKVAVQAQRERKLKPWHRNGDGIGMTSSGAQLRTDGTKYYARVDFHGSTLNVFVDTVPTFSSPVLTLSGATVTDLIAMGLDGSAWIGITSSTDESIVMNELHSWSVDGCNTLSVGVESEELRGVSSPSVVPTPSSDLATLRWAAAPDAAHVYIYDLTGTRIASLFATAEALWNGIQLPIAELSTGVYRLQLALPDELVSIPLVIQR